MPRTSSMLLAVAFVAAMTQVAAARPSFSGKEQAVEPPVPDALKRAGFEQKLDAQVDLSLPFRNEAGETVTLAQLVDGKPTIINLVYYDCPMLCTEVLNGLLESVKDVPFTPGVEYTILTISFDPSEGPELAAAKRQNYLKEFNRPGAEKGWHFLVGDQASIESLTKSVGFTYAFDEKSGEYGHASGIVVMTPQGHVSRYFFGIAYPPKEVRLSLVDASNGKIGSKIDQLLLLCFHYNPVTGKYSVAVMSLLRFGAALTVLAVGWAIVVAVLRRSPPAAPKTPAAGAGAAT